ncbi:hypothetical protein C449_07725 [Halococcus saccharolyticus DSM 5350]|uniref:Uncharacterized protein n=1 Tax=Halococcus saccharolyticus DSM 5350 TaxID=1227455 RepID=M0MIH1_9EURY|nr:hypothetical protein C449_07725 [Halococcus saccharolyticus DSM 5350]
MNISLDTDVKEEWQQYVDEHPDYRYVSHLVRAAVGKEIRGQYGGGGGASGDVAERLSDIESLLLDIQNGVDDVHDRMDAVESQLEGPSTDVTDLAGDVFECLPSEGMAGRTTQDVLSGEEHAVDEGTVLTGRISDIADHLDTDPIRVRQALQQLKEDTPLVDSQNIGGDESWFRVN